MVKVTLLRQLDGREAGEVAEYPELDAKRLAARGVVKIAKAEPAHETKMEAAPANKAAPKRKGS